MSKQVHFEIRHGNGNISDANGNYNFDTAEKAIEEAKRFKNKPRSHNPKMTDENVKYWKAQLFIVRRVTVEIDNIETI